MLKIANQDQINEIIIVKEGVGLGSGIKDSLLTNVVL